MIKASRTMGSLEKLESSSLDKGVRLEKSYSQLALDHSFSRLPLIDKLRIARRILEMSPAKESPAIQQIIGHKLLNSRKVSPQKQKPKNNKYQPSSQSVEPTNKAITNSKPLWAKQHQLPYPSQDPLRLKIQASSIPFQKLSIEQKQLDLELDAVELDIKSTKALLSKVADQRKLTKIRTEAEANKLREKEELLLLYDQYILVLCDKRNRKSKTEKKGRSDYGESFVQERQQQLQWQKANKQKTRLQFRQEDQEYSEFCQALKQQRTSVAKQTEALKKQNQQLIAENLALAQTIENRQKQQQLWSSRQKRMHITFHSLKTQEQDLKIQAQKILDEVRLMNELTTCQQLHKNIIPQIEESVQYMVLQEMRQAYQFNEGVGKFSKKIENLKDDIHRNELRIRLKDAKIQELLNVMEYQKEELVLLEQSLFSRKNSPRREPSGKTQAELTQEMIGASGWLVDESIVVRTELNLDDQTPHQEKDAGQQKQAQKIDEVLA